MDRGNWKKRGTSNADSSQEERASAEPGEVYSSENPIETAQEAEWLHFPSSQDNMEDCSSVIQGEHQKRPVRRSMTSQTSIGLKKMRSLVAATKTLRRKCSRLKEMNSNLHSQLEKLKKDFFEMKALAEANGALTLQVTSALRYLLQYGRRFGIFGFEDCLPTIELMEMIFKWFTIHNIRNTTFHVVSRDQNRMPFSSPDDDSDPVEALFSTIRQLQGSNDQTDARAALSSLQKVLVMGMMHSSPSGSTEQTTSPLGSPSARQASCSTAVKQAGQPLEMHSLVNQNQGSSGECAASTSATITQTMRPHLEALQTCRGALFISR
ncbi:hypothetical protein HPB51_018395 [Rhipicephalus microplus]|uniref:Uncharacterized protein n=1 Tax=Rhipicephalus microplus TaxID=6941 RepID=A0A9J6ETU6_RHIMP|nr:hypothetical protein HPB51_018395 [Rhipicephalus microplus]